MSTVDDALPDTEIRLDESPLAGLLRTRDEIAAEVKVLDVEVPEQPNPTWLRFRKLNYAKARKGAEQVQGKGPEREAQENARLLAGVCVGIWFDLKGRTVTLGDDGRLVDVDPVDEHADLCPLGPDVARVAGYPGDDAAGLLRELFDNDFALGDAFRKVFDWTRGATSEATQRLGKR